MYRPNFLWKIVMTSSKFPMNWIILNWNFEIGIKVLTKSCFGTYEQTRPTDRQTDLQTGRQTDRQTTNFLFLFWFYIDYYSWRPCTTSGFRDLACLYGLEFVLLVSYVRPEKEGHCSRNVGNYYFSNEIKKILEQFFTHLKILFLLKM